MQYKLDLALLAQVADVAVVQSVHMKLDQFKIVHRTRQDKTRKQPYPTPKDT